MGMWDYDEVHVYDNGEDFDSPVDVTRTFGVCNQMLTTLPKLQVALEKMLDGLSYVDVEEGTFDLDKTSTSTKPRWGVYVVVTGVRKQTAQELEKKKKEKVVFAKKEENADLRTLRTIKKRSPHLFDLV